MKKILFVCTGNVCRSPMAEGYCVHFAGARKLEVYSAGLGAMDGQSPSSLAVRVMDEAGIDIDSQSSNLLTAQMVNEADYIFGMAWGHVQGILLMYPRAADKTFLLREFEENLSEHEREVSDPIGGDYNVYLTCRDQIEKGVRSVLKFIDQTSMNTVELNEPVIKLAMGSDHGGFELKESLKRHLKKHGYEIADHGSVSKDAVDYPDFADAVCESVLSEPNTFGVLVCTTGVGMSIAANKHVGVRAALVNDEATARICRKHNGANVICLAGNTDATLASRMVDAFITGQFEGGRHERRIGKLRDGGAVSIVDPAVSKVLRDETRRQRENIELIASENFTSRAVMEAQGSALTNKYAEGYPGKRWYGGCEHVDVVEQLAIDRAKQLFGAEYANVQPHSGSGANMAVYFSTLQPGDRMLTMDLSHGGHLTHGNKANFSGKFFEIIHYGVRKEDELIDYDQLAEMARAHKPKMITVGASAYSRVIDFERMGQIAREVGAMMLADIAHIAGLVAAGLHPSPVPHADFVTTTTHKTLRGPRGGLVLAKEKYAKQINSMAFPGIQGGPLMHVIAAKAICLQEALQPEFKKYQQQIARNAKALSAAMQQQGFRIVSGGTDNHLMMVDVGAKGLTGKECQLALDEAGITVNKNTIPFETRSPFEGSGIRLGTPAVTTRGMGEPEMVQIAGLISQVLKAPKSLDAAHAVRKCVRELTARFPLPY